MCDFVSWIEYEGKNYWLKDKDLETKEGKKLLKEVSNGDICGHGAIRTYYAGGQQKVGQKLQWGKERQCTDFSNPNNFPAEIVKCIKSGGMSRIGISLQLLNDVGKAEYKKVEGQALAEYKKVMGPAFWKIFQEKKNRALAWV